MAKMTFIEVLSRQREIWGHDRLTLVEIVVRLGVNYGKLCRIARGADKDDTSKKELELAMGHIITSMVRWTNDLNLNIDDCINAAHAAQADFALKNDKR